VGEWQAIRDENLPFMSTIEVEDITLDIAIPPTIEEWQETVKPNLPWAEEHFLERVSGVPLNPPPSHVRWPFAQKDNEAHTQDTKFSHTYPERFFPLFAGNPAVAHKGIRFRYGDLTDLVDLLRRRNNTRQAYLPVWFPEDLAAAAMGERVPCSLGYHFLQRNGQLKIVYYIRSCDFYRHFRDDVYMAGRLCQWVAEATGFTPSHLVMYISSLHIFSAERGRIRADAGIS
jgi:hypothetical protein